MKRLTEYIMDDSSLSEVEDDDNVEMAMDIILNDEVRQPRLGSHFHRAYINQDRAEGHAKIMRDYCIEGAT
jgi:hypothetical protein